MFAFVYETADGDLIALRDHLGNVPLYYRFTPTGVRFSVALADLVAAGDDLDAHGVDVFLALGTAKLAPLISGVHVVPPGTAIKIARGSTTPETLFEYRLQPGPASSLSIDELVHEVDRLMVQAVQRTLRSDSVGLYLSGGIDSALVAHYVKRAGAAVTGYTSSPWGAAGTEIAFAKINAERTAVDRHVIVPLDTATYPMAVREVPHLYGAPHGITTLIAVASLWRESGIAAESQLYFGQNTDTMTCSMPQQYLVYFLHRLPGAVRRRLHPSLGREGPLADYLSFATDGKLTAYEPFSRVYGGLDPLPLLTLAGMYVVHTPVDGECLSLPAVRRGMLASNPYYDMDLVEFCVRTPLRHRLTVSRSSKLLIQLEKRVYRRLASRFLPRELVFRKKGFTVPLIRDSTSREFEAGLPRRFEGRVLSSRGERFASAVLEQFKAEYELG